MEVISPTDLVLQGKYVCAIFFLLEVRENLPTTHVSW
jgi:hypothetical protein